MLPRGESEHAKVFDNNALFRNFVRELVKTLMTDEPPQLRQLGHG